MEKSYLVIVWKYPYQNDDYKVIDYQGVLPDFITSEEAIDRARNRAKFYKNLKGEGIVLICEIVEQLK